MEQTAVQRAVEDAARILHGALHLVENDAFEREAAAAVCLQAMSFLKEVVAPQAWEEHGIEVNL